jgi:DNA/RNA endonuclease G (NUC1)
MAKRNQKLETQFENYILNLSENEQQEIMVKLDKIISEENL